jgi:RHS repeat-associated protein
VDADGTVEDTSDDPWYRFAYDDRWRISATFRDDDSDPKEQFVYHTAGNDGRGRSSYIDAVILRDKDANTDWEDESDGTLEERVYYCQNWRSDVVALVTDTGQQVEQVRYSSYGVPFGLPAGDADSDGDVDSSDLTQIQSWIDAPAYDVRGDLDLDGDVDATDKTTASGNQGKSGWGVLSNVGNRKGYAGYELDDAIADAYRNYHVRNRVFNADLGRWTRRDPLGYIDGVGLYHYTRSNPVVSVDSYGTQCSGEICTATFLYCRVFIENDDAQGSDCELYSWWLWEDLMAQHCGNANNEWNSCTDSCWCNPQNDDDVWTDGYGCVEQVQEIVDDCGCPHIVTYRVCTEMEVWVGTCSWLPFPPIIVPSPEVPNLDPPTPGWHPSAAISILRL